MKSPGGKAFGGGKTKYRSPEMLSHLRFGEAGGSQLKENVQSKERVKPTGGQIMWGWG